MAAICHGVCYFATFQLTIHWGTSEPAAGNRYLSMSTLQWHHNEGDGISKHRQLDGLLNCLFRHRSKKTSKLRVTGLCEGNSPVTGEFPSQRASNVENIPIWWRHNEHGFKSYIRQTNCVSVAGMYMHFPVPVQIFHKRYIFYRKFPYCDLNSNKVCPRVQWTIICHWFTLTKVHDTMLCH